MTTGYLQLPALTTSPIFYPDCCLSLSTLAIAAIAEKLYGHGDLVLSVGSGSGLLETILQGQYALQIEGVEVSQTVNRYLPEERIHIVNGTWAVSPLALLCSALLFVYPRDPSLLSRYIQGAAASPNLRMVLWVGPAVDWEAFQRCFKSRYTVEDPIQLSDSEILVRAVRTC
jgi:hypothetical protein